MYKTLKEVFIECGSVFPFKVYANHYASTDRAADKVIEIVSSNGRVWKIKDGENYEGETNLESYADKAWYKAYDTLHDLDPIDNLKQRIARLNTMFTELKALALNIDKVKTELALIETLVNECDAELTKEPAFIKEVFTKG